MVEGYELVEYRDPKGRPFWELTTSPANSQFQKMLTDPKKKLAARKMIDQISKIYDYGLKVASGTSKLRCIDSKIGLYELKGFDGANREMIYAICQGVDKIVLLFWFKGHQGSGNISKEIERAKRLAVIARQLLETERRLLYLAFETENTMNKVDLSDFYAETETSETRAYEHALDIEFIVHREMKHLGLSKSELAKRMGVSLQSLSKLLNSQPNMTLKTIARFELALGINIVPKVTVNYSKELPFLSSNESLRKQWSFRNERPSSHVNLEMISGGLAA